MASVKQIEESLQARNEKAWWKDLNVDPLEVAGSFGSKATKGPASRLPSGAKSARFSLHSTYCGGRGDAKSEELPSRKPPPAA